MSSCSVQFHALNEELFTFIEELRTDNELFIFCSDDLRLREYSIINTDCKAEIVKNRRIFFLRRIKDRCEVQGENSLIIYCGHQNEKWWRRTFCFLEKSNYNIQKETFKRCNNLYAR